MRVSNLKVSFNTDKARFVAVDDVSFDILQGEIVGLVGESGCGKSVSALSLLRLVPMPPGIIEGGRVDFKGTDLLQASIEAVRQVRGREISMIFQEPLSALSPLQRIGQQMVETIQLHRDIPKSEAWQISLEWLGKVKIPDAEEKMHAYPFQLSGGMQQRIMIAMALILNPDLIIADEPTTALDVTIQAQVFELIREMKAEDTAILLITHDMGVVWEMCDRVLVMYASKIVEQGTTADIFSAPAHPYTYSLLKSIPSLSDGKGDKLAVIPGSVPSPENYPSGCRFRDRCPYAFERCKSELPELVPVSDGHQAACFIAGKFIER
jgi:peptide/nickel transport system ATP-binding protein/oligopeptide transport system ATP-binding protein